MTASSRLRRATRLLPATAALLLAGCAALAPTPAAVDGLQPPATVQNVAGATIPYAGTQGWAQATVRSDRSRDLAVLAFGSEREGGGTCGPQLLRVLTRESRSAVHVLVAAYEVPTDPAVQCGPLSGIPTAHVVRLQRPLAGRTVIDAASGQAVPVLVGTTVTRTWTTGTGERGDPGRRRRER